MDSDFIWSCGRKKKHRTQEFAENSLKKGMGKVYDTRYHTYKCNYCLGYHVGRKRFVGSVLTVSKENQDFIEDGMKYRKVSNNNKYKLLNAGWQLIDRPDGKYLRTPIEK
jgi:hypothetical protein